MSGPIMKFFSTLKSAEQYSIDRVAPVGAFVIRRRSWFGRLMRAPKLFAHSWRLSRGSSVCTRLYFAAINVRALIRD